MSAPADSVQPHITVITLGQQRLSVSVSISYDGVEYIGRLWFTEDGWANTGIPDRGVLPGRSKQEVEGMAKRLTERELITRYRRAAANQRRFLTLRAATDEFLHKVRYLNQVAISMRAGLIDNEGAAQELDHTEHQMHQLIHRLRSAAGIDEARV